MAEATPPRGFRDRPPSPWLTKREAAEYSGFSKRTIEIWIAEGRLRATGGGYKGAPPVRIRTDWLDDCLERRGDGRRDGR